MDYTDTKQSATNLGLSFGVVNCLVVFPTHFSPNNSLIILLQISLLFMCTPALMEIAWILVWHQAKNYLEYRRRQHKT